MMGLSSLPVSSWGCSYVAEDMYELHWHPVSTAAELVKTTTCHPEPPQQHSKSVDLTWDVQQEKALPEGSVCDGSELISCPLSMCSSLALRAAP